MTDIVERLRLKKQLNTVEDVHELFADAADEIERLREALRRIADGDVPRQHAVIWRRDGELSKHDKCPHYQVMYEGCEECVSSFARAALEGKE